MEGRKNDDDDDDVVIVENDVHWCAPVLSQCTLTRVENSFKLNNFVSFLFYLRGPESHIGCVERT